MAKRSRDGASCITDKALTDIPSPWRIERFPEMGFDGWYVFPNVSTFSIYWVVYQFFLFLFCIFASKLLGRSSIRIGLCLQSTAETVRWNGFLIELLGHTADCDNVDSGLGQLNYQRDKNGPKWQALISFGWCTDWRGETVSNDTYARTHSTGFHTTRTSGSAHVGL